MNLLTQTLQSSLGPDVLAQLGNQLGTDDSKTQSILDTALPMLTGALGSNSRDTQGASALAAALDKDHDGSILDDVAGFLSKGDAADGEGILKHALGDKKQDLEDKLGQNIGIDTSTIHKALPLLAPIVMGALCKVKRQNGLSVDGITDLLKDEVSPGNIFQTLLDRDKDGSVTDDLLAMGTKAVGSFFRK